MNFESHLNPAGGGLTRKRRRWRFISCIFKPEFAAWLNEFVYGPFGTCWLNLRASVLSIYSTMRRVQIMQTLAGNASFQTSIHFNCWKLMRNCFSGIIVPPISSYSLVRKYNFKALIVPSFFLFYQLSVFFSQSHFYFANYDGNQMEKCNLLRWKEAFVP